jgi:hypothetical protein
MDVVEVESVVPARTATIRNFAYRPELARANGVAHVLTSLPARHVLIDEHFFFFFF